MTAQELAVLFLEQMRAYDEGVPPPRPEPNAVWVWEELICDEPEEAWPVFEELLARTTDDETLEQIWYRLRLLLHWHYDDFHEGAAALFDRYPRLRVIAGSKALDAATYAEKPFDREALIAAYQTFCRNQNVAIELQRLAQADPPRALSIAVEIIHRGVARGWSSFDLMDPLREVLTRAGRHVIDEAEELARQSAPVRRVLWRLRRQVRPEPDPGKIMAPFTIDPHVWERAERAAGATTDYTELDAPVQPPQKQPDVDEQIIQGWFAYQKNFWAFSALNDLCDEKPLLAWDITLDLIDRARDEIEFAVAAAGPLEDLIRNHPDAIWNDLVERAHTNERFRSAVRGVWVPEDDGELYRRFTELLATLDAEPN